MVSIYMDILMYQEQSSRVFRCFAANDSNEETLRPLSELIPQLEIPLDHLTNFGSTVNGTA